MRYKEFNTNKVLEDCITIFWQKSFGGTSISEIVKATKVNRYSLYQEFTNKRGILEAALQLYLERYSRKYFSNIDAGLDLKSSLQQFYCNFLESNSNHPSGCFILYIATELADKDKEVKLLLIEYLEEMKGTLKNMLEKHPNYQGDQNVLIENLTGLFCGSMSLCYVQKEQQKMDHVNLKLDFLLN